MLSKSFTASIFLLALTSFVNADCVISPPLGVTGSPAASNVQQPSDAAPCGSIPISQNIDTSSAIQADGNGQFAPSITNFATGADGSRLIKSVKVDPTGTGNSFVDCEIVTNGENDPTNKGTQQLAVKLPAGTKCTGGTDKNRCLASFVTSAGYGNCVVVTLAGTAVQNSTVSASPKTGKAQLATDSQNGDKNGDKNGDQTQQNQKTDGEKPKNQKRMMRSRRV